MRRVSGGVPRSSRPRARASIDAGRQRRKDRGRDVTVRERDAAQRREVLQLLDDLAGHQLEFLFGVLDSDQLAGHADPVGGDLG